jgi:hypothetical protein
MYIVMLIHEMRPENENRSGIATAQVMRALPVMVSHPLCVKANRCTA